MTIFGALRLARCASIWSASHCTFTIARSTPPSAKRSRQWSMSVRPRTVISGFGNVSVIGRIRMPSPAANTMAVLGTGGLIGPRRSASRVGFDRRWTQRPRQVVAIPDRERLKQWMGEIARQVALDPRQVMQVLWLAVALVEPGEQAKDLGGALGAHRGIGGGEALGVKGGFSGRPAPHIEGGQTHLEILLH